MTPLPQHHKDMHEMNSDEPGDLYPFCCQAEIDAVDSGDIDKALAIYAESYRGRHDWKRTGIPCIYAGEIRSLYDFDICANVAVLSVNIWGVTKLEAVDLDAIELNPTKSPLLARALGVKL